jgi:hypothetical protein
VYQLVSTDVSPDRNHISSDSEESSEMDVGTLDGCAMRANASTASQYTNIRD